MKAVSWWQCILVFEKLANMTVECLSWYVRVSHKVTPSYFHKASFFTLGLYFGLKLPPIAFWILKNKEVLVPTDFIMYSSWFTHCPFLSILFMLVKQRVMNCRNPKRNSYEGKKGRKNLFTGIYYVRKHQKLPPLDVMMMGITCHLFMLLLYKKCIIYHFLQESKLMHISSQSCFFPKRFKMWKMAFVGPLSKEGIKIERCNK